MVRLKVYQKIMIGQMGVVLQLGAPVTAQLRMQRLIHVALDALKRAGISETISTQQGLSLI